MSPTPPKNALPSRAYANYVLGVFFALTALNVMDRQVLALLIEPIKQEFQVSDAAMGLLSGTSFTIFHILAAIPVARWADRGNRRAIVTAGLFAWSALTAATGLARSYTHIFVARVGVGIGETVGSGPTQSLLSDYFPPERRATALSILGSGGVVGSMLAFGLGGLIGERFGWRLTFVFFGLPGIALAALLWSTVKEPIRGAVEGLQDSAQTQSVGECIRFLLKLPAFRHVVLMGGLNAFANYTLIIWAQPFLMRSHGMSLSAAGLTLALGMSACSTLGLWVSGFAGDRLSRRDVRWYCYLPAVASSIAVPLSLGFLTAANLSTAIAFLVPAAFFNTMWLGNSNAMVQGLAKPRMRAIASALNLAGNSGIGLGLGPLLVGIVSDWLQPSQGQDSLRYALMLAMCAGFWASIHALLAARSLREDLLAKSRD
ncbi:MFS transporter [Myxococcota bacterium]|nr:MFS transporter [Myxococcota bacterium]